jgi:tetratricopeptide (TPR) repeat protein
MRRTARAALLAALVACASPAPPDSARRAPLLEGIGTRPFALTTASPDAQRYFEQGLALSYAFNHAEAARSFREAMRLDPGCALCHWGLALVLGPNINAPMRAGDHAEAWGALSLALALAPRASERERALVHALARRYAPEMPADRTPLDRAYADAMREVALAHPGDVDALVLFAEALMDAHPWDYWEKSGAPRPWTPELVATLEAALALDPLHAGANHLCIHAFEASKEPGRGLACAERLGALAPAAGHLVHMPSHIYIRVGRYHAGTLANERAIEADRSYLAQCRQQGLYPLAYAPHNHHFLWATATLEGASAKALSAAHQTGAMVDHEEMREPGMGMLQHFAAIPLFARVRFGRWEEILAQPAPEEDLAYLRAIFHYARGIALARSGRPAQAASELVALESAAGAPALAEVAPWGGNPAPALVRIAVRVLAGEIAAARRDWDAAAAELREAVRLEDALHYNEPPDWFFPVRQSLGAVLLEAGRPVEAERVYRDDLLEFPENGWSLFGLRQSLEAQGRAGEAREAARRFAEAWRYADVELPGSRF